MEGYASREPASQPEDTTRMRWVWSEDTFGLMLMARKYTADMDQAWSPADWEIYRRKALEALDLRDKILDLELPRSERTVVGHVGELAMFAAEEDLLRQARELAGHVEEAEI